MRGLINRIRDAFGGGPRLRNKPGGMAYVRGLPDTFGAGLLNGQIVKTVRLNDIGTWNIEPRLQFTATKDMVSRQERVRIKAGQHTTVVAMEDCFLEPLPDTGITAEEVRELYAPRAPQREKERA